MSLELHQDRCGKVQKNEKSFEAPWKVALFYDDDLLCGGTLISNDAIITGMFNFQSKFFFSRI